MELRAVARPRQPVDVAMLRNVTDTLPRNTQPADSLIRAMRDRDRYWRPIANLPPRAQR